MPWFNHLVLLTVGLGELVFWAGSISPVKGLCGSQEEELGRAVAPACTSGRARTPVRAAAARTSNKFDFMAWITFNLV